MAAEYNTEEIKCPQINSIQTTANKYLCNSQWPRYPCYNKEDRLCYNVDGVQSLDPIGDLLYVLNELICRLQSTLLSESEKSLDPSMSQQKRLQMEQEKLRSLEMLNSYWTYFGSSLKCPEIVLQADNLRYMEDYLDYTKELIDRVKILFSKKKGGKKNKKTKKTKKIMKNKRKKTRGKHIKNKKTIKNYKKV